MAQNNNLNLQEDNDLKKVTDLVLKNYLLFIFSLIVALSLAFLINRYSIPVYQISSSVLIKENQEQSGGMNDFLNSNLFGKNQNFQNELWVFESLPVFQNTVKNIDLSVSYHQKKGFQDIELYNNAPFRILYSPAHIQPLGVRFYITFYKGGKFHIKAESKKLSFYNYSTEAYEYEKSDWSFEKNGEQGKLIETQDLAFIVKVDSTKNISDKLASSYSFSFVDQNALAESYKNSFKFDVVDKKATVIEISMLSTSVNRGIDLINELMNVYSKQNLERKNHIASITIDYIDKQLGEISDSLSITESNLQRFRSANQLLDVAQQSTGVSSQYIDLQNQRAELVTRKRYYDYVADYLTKNEDFSNMIIPSSMGIPDQILTTLMTELIAAQSQRSNLIDNNQERNPLVNKLTIKIDNLRKTIADNISAVRQTTDISIDEMNKRVSKIESKISSIPKTEQQLGGFERKYKLNDAIYNYLLEKRAEAKITQASNLPDDIIIEPAHQVGSGPISPNKKKNYFIAFMLGIGLPLGFLILRKALNTLIETQENVERITDVPVLGKIMHNYKKSTNVVFEFPKSPISESYRVLRTNLDFSLKGGGPKVILVTSCITGEGKSFNALNIAMSYAQLGRRTILLDFDLRKPSSYFSNQENQLGLSSYLINNTGLQDIIHKSPDAKLDYINSGLIPPNPAELLALNKTKNMIQGLKDDYEYIIIDTPPLAQVTDGFLLMESADLKLIIVRYNFSKKKIISMVLKDLAHKKIENIYIALNDNRIKSDQYGYGYGYNKKGK
ncbi:MAG: polysaccharide biosynthesis tyrosine autokinase [Lentimicrobiaceae bacterium]|jgi:capsular exopolysaccharide synthesis family protein